MKSIFKKFLFIHWDAILASAGGCLFIYYFTRHSGIGISPDSVTYLSTANNIRDHLSFTDFNGLPMVDFPLGYSSILAIISLLTGAEVVHMIPIMNGLLFSGVLLLTSIIIHGYNQNLPFYKTFFLALLACSPCLLEVYSMLWSETFFLFLILLFIIAIRNYLCSHNLSSLLLVVIIVSVALVTRYAGICLLGTGLFFLIFDGNLTLKRKIKQSIFFTLIGSSLLVTNLIRNGKANGHLTGIREKSIHSVNEILQQIGITISEWLPFFKNQERLATFLFIIILLFGTLFLFYRILQQQYFHTYETIVLCFFVLYAFFIITIASFSRFEDLSSRLLSPLYIPILLLVSQRLVALQPRLVRMKRMALLILLLFFYGGFHYHHFRLNTEAWEGIKDAGIPGYTEDSWAKSPAITFIKANKDQFMAPVIANANDAVYFLTGIHAQSLPHKEIALEVNAFLQKNPFYLFWFVDGENADLVNLDFINRKKNLRLVKELEGNQIFFVSDKTSQSPAK